MNTATTSMDIHRILEKLPHRYPFLMIDRVLDVQPGAYVKAIKNVTINEPFFPGHFPVKPVMPGVMMIEALAQAAAMLAFVTKGTAAGDDTVVYLLGIDNARFKRVVEPGDQLILEAWQDRVRAGIYRYKAKASVGEQMAVECELICTERPA